MRFVDELEVKICSGSGGNGVIKWNTTGINRMGGPAGGNGGNGGDVYFVGIRDIDKLSEYVSNPNFKAGDGGNGGANSLTGKNGENIYIDVPVGSVIKKLDSEEEYEIVEFGQKIKVLNGGRCGYGNEHFKSSTNVSPYIQTDGKPGECARFKIELRLIADAGLVGLPNAGKSTILNTITNTSIKTGNYDFTTLEPNLGVFNGYVLADIPGLIEGASVGRGLGYKFLQHIMRTKSLIHCISAERDDLIGAYNIIRNELTTYNNDLAKKYEIVLITKTDLIENSEKQNIKQQFNDIGVTDIYFISVLDDVSVNKFKSTLSNILQK